MLCAGGVDWWNGPLRRGVAAEPMEAEWTETGLEVDRKWTGLLEEAPDQ